jgi:cytochrome oxidase Cu insertion factor (SCO1/SenC/PrrC family)
MSGDTDGKTLDDAGFGERPWVVNFRYWYCTSADADACDTNSDVAIYDNAQTKWTWAIIAWPE